MSKYSWIWIITIFLILMTVTADSVLVTYTADITEDIATGNETTLTGLLRLGQTFWRILTFQLEGFPAILNIIIFLPLTFTLIFLIIDMLKGLLPFTSGGG